MGNFLIEAAHDTVATKVGKVTSRRVRHKHPKYGERSKVPRVPISTNAAASIKVSYAALYMNPS
ncbi:MAG: hypothetical protein ABJZ90_20420 [Paracoccaceae bacterium]